MCSPGQVYIMADTKNIDVVVSMPLSSSATSMFSVSVWVHYIITPSNVRFLFSWGKAAIRNIRMYLFKKNVCKPVNTFPKRSKNAISSVADSYVGTRAATAVTKRLEIIERAEKIESIIPATAPRRWQKIVSDN